MLSYNIYTKITYNPKKAQSKLKNIKTKLLHQHLIKCGGTTANSFISTKFDANKALDAGSIRNLNISSKLLIDNPTRSDIDEINYRLAIYRVNSFHFVHGHSPLAHYTPNNFFKFIILRNPVNRVVSQIQDWKRLSNKDLEELPEENKLFKKFTRDSTIYQVASKWAQSKLSIYNLSNMQTRLVFISKMGYDSEFSDYSKHEQIKIAKEALLEYDLIGITENYYSSIVELCYKNKWCPPTEIIHLNSSEQKTNIDQKAVDLITEINDLDFELYEEAVRIKSLNPFNSNYTTEDFEQNYASERTHILTPIYKDNTYLFNFNMPIIGNGFHFRDASNTPECAIWTGPGLVTSLFLPIIEKCDINVLLYIKGFSDLSIKNNVKLEIDGNIYPHKFQKHNGLDSVLIARYVTVRNFIHLKIHIDKVYNSESDKRMRGISLLKYGFSCNI